MKKTLIIVGIIGVIALFFIGKYNGMVEADENVNSAWSQVENQYQRRLDLIPNLVSTVKGYAAHESSTLEAVVNARAKATSMQVNIEDAESLAKYQAAQGELTQAMSRLLMVTENYPDLKANEQFLALQSKLEGTENRISTERGRFNDIAKEYNKMIRIFPNNIVASMFGFKEKAYFKADEGAEKAPQVQF